MWKKALRPNVTLFGESLPIVDWDNTLKEVQKSNILIVVVSSLEVSSVNQISRFVNGKTVYINDNIGEVGNDFDFTIQGKAKEVLEESNHYIIN